MQLYNGSVPFASFLKKYYGQNKKFGSNDRRHITHLCYSFFRLGKAAIQLPTEERILLGFFLGSASPHPILQELRPQLNANVSFSVKEKCSIFNVQCSMFNLFPWKDELSIGMDYEAFALSFLEQPDLFIRIRPGKEKIVRAKLEQAGINYTMPDPHCIALLNSTKIEKYLEVNKEVVIQDLSSQRIANFFPNLQPSTSNLQPQIWDCCAGSGGKSILLYDTIPNIYLTVSDIRSSILVNLKKRFDQASIKTYESFIADLSSTSFVGTDIRVSAKNAIRNSNFDLILADIPCTGSGTWARTPEALSYFDEKSIEEYSLRQKKIAGNTISFLKYGGFLLYITCSVFRKENEEIVYFLEKEYQLRIVMMELLKGYEKKADTMFAALLQK